VTSAIEAEPEPTKRTATARKQPFARSRTGNGKTLLAGIDQRSLPYREYQDTVADLVHHLGGEPSAVEAAIAAEAAGLIVWCRSARIALLKGEAFDVGAYTTGVNALRRLLADIGQERRLHELNPPSLAAYLEGKAHEKAKGA
jgi:hypothetical protein